MDEFDKKIKELARKVDVPKGYSERVTDVLESLPDDEDSPPRKRRDMRGNNGTTKNNRRRLRPAIGLALCVICIVSVLAVLSLQAEANVLESFKKTVLDFLRVETEAGEDAMSQEELGVDSNTTEIQSARDLMLETKEIVMDAQGIYLLFKLTAPPDVELSEDITFDYFGFCEGENYNAADLIGGGISCTLFERVDEKPNVATYMMSLSSDMRPYDGKMLTAFFQNLTLDPFGENPQLLVEGMWRLSFMTEMTVSDSLMVKGTEDMRFPILGKEGVVKQIDMTPLGVTLTVDLSEIPADVLNVSDASVSLRLKMIDGSEIYIMPGKSGEESIVDTGSCEYGDDIEHPVRKDVYLFKKTVDLSKVLGFYVQDVYIPAR